MFFFLLEVLEMRFSSFIFLNPETFCRNSRPRNLRALEDGGRREETESDGVEEEEVE